MKETALPTPIKHAPVCVLCGGVLDDFRCNTCCIVDPPIQGVVGQAMPGSEWTSEVRFGRGTHLEHKKLCAVVRRADGRLEAWAQFSAGTIGAGEWRSATDWWETVGHRGMSAVILEAFGSAMLLMARKSHPD